MSDGRDVQYFVAMAETIEGDAAKSQASVTDLVKRFPEDTLVQSIYLPTIRGHQALLRHDTAKAISELQPGDPFELGQPTTASTISDALYPINVRAQAY